MAEPSGALTMRDLVLRVAEKLGIAEYTSAGLKHVPTDQFNLNLCKQYVNGGIKMFMADAPKKGWRWMRRICSVTFATRVTGTADAADATSITDLTLADTYDTDDDLNDWWCYILTGTGLGSYAQITDYTGATGKCDVADWLDSDGNPGGTNPAASSTFAITSVKTDAGDAAKYILPSNFGGTVDGPIEYAADTSVGTDIEWCDESTIRARRSLAVNSGIPSRAAIRPYQPMDESLSQSRQWELIVDPQPGSAYVVEFPYTLHFNKMDLEAGVADSGGNTTLVDATRTEGADYFNTWKIEIVAGTGLGSYAIVTDFTAGGTFTVADWLTSAGAAGGTNPGTDSIYVVQPAANLHPAGHQFDDAIEAACLARAEMESQDEHMDTFWTDYYHKKALLNAFKVDQRSAPRKLGPMISGPPTRRIRLGDSAGFTYLDSSGASVVQS